MTQSITALLIMLIKLSSSIFHRTLKSSLVCTLIWSLFFRIFPISIPPPSFLSQPVSQTVPSPYNIYFLGFSFSLSSSSSSPSANMTIGSPSPDSPYEITGSSLYVVWSSILTPKSSATCCNNSSSPISSCPSLVYPICPIISDNPPFMTGFFPIFFFTFSGEYWSG